jgi:hypothetical protein
MTSYDLVLTKQRKTIIIIMASMQTVLVITAECVSHCHASAQSTSLALQSKSLLLNDTNSTSPSMHAVSPRLPTALSGIGNSQ